MATIYSNRNDSAGSHTTVDPNTGTTWLGGLVPAVADTVYVVGRRATINQAAFAKWADTRTITVSSTTYFASSGFFYTVTTCGEIVKINYTGVTATTFTGCSVDETDSFYAWAETGSTIANSSYVHNPAYIIEVGPGDTFECDIMIIQEGGYIIVNGGTLKINNYITVRDGRFVGRSGTLIISRPAGTAAASTVGDFTGENYQLSIIDIDGGDVRTYASLSTDAAKGTSSVAITGLTNGNFAIGDEVAIYGYNDYRRRNKGYTGYRDATASFKDMDEGCDVCGVSGSTIYLAKRNGARGSIKAITTVSTQKVLEVSPENVYFNANDKIVVNNTAYTIDSVEDSEFQLYTYDFTNVGTSLTDFWVDDATHIYSSGWTIESGVGLKNANASYKELIHKSFWSREVIIEAEMSPLSAYSSGTRGTAAFGLCTSYDPAYRWGHRGYDSIKSDYFIIDDVNQDLYFAIRSMTNYNNNRSDRDVDTLNLTRGAAKYRIDNRKAKSTVYINDQEFTTEFRRDGAFKGLVGIFSNANTNFRCKNLTIKVPTQKLYITTTDSFTVGHTVHESGFNHAHLAGSKIVKIAAINSGDSSHVDLAFAYRGQQFAGEWPLIMQLNGTNTANASFPYLHNHDMNADYYYDLGNAATAKSITIDLLSQKTFTHVSFIPRFADYATYYGMNGVAVYGSNDLTSWTTLYGPTNDTKKRYYANYNNISYYPTGTVSYRYVKFETKGAQHATYFTNRYVNIGVHNFSEGYTISVNNAGDFNIGDKITVSTDCGYSIGSRELEAYYACVTFSSDPETYWQYPWSLECTITNKIGNKLYLDKPIFWGYIEHDDTVKVIKTNRNFTITGTMVANGVFADWRWPNITLLAGASVCRKYLFRNVRLSYIGSYRYSGSTSYNRGFRNYSYDYWNATLLDGCVHMFGPDGTTWAGIGNYTGYAIFRNNVVIGMYSGYWNYPPVSYLGAAYFNNKILNNVYGIYSQSQKAFVFNYNEIASCDGAIVYFGGRVDRMVIPYSNEMSYNTIKGSSNYAINIDSETIGPVRLPRLKLENNKIRSMDDYSLIGQTFSGFQYEGSNFMSEHTGSRLSRYRNEGHFSEGTTSSDLSLCHHQKNFGRFGCDLIHGVYYWYERDYQTPDVLRIYNPSNDSFLAALGIELDILADIDFTVTVQFEYKIPWMARLQDDGLVDGQITVYSLQHGTILNTQYSITPANAGLGWNTFNYTYTFAAQEGKAAVYLTRDARNGYMDVRNSTAYIITENPDKIQIIGNTFVLENVWDQYNERIPNDSTFVIRLGL
jgi:hypothetical protein